MWVHHEGTVNGTSGGIVIGLPELTLYTRMKVTTAHASEIEPGNTLPDSPAGNLLHLVCYRSSRQPAQFISHLGLCVFHAATAAATLSLVQHSAIIRYQAWNTVANRICHTDVITHKLIGGCIIPVCSKTSTHKKETERKLSNAIDN